MSWLFFFFAHPRPYDKHPFFISIGSVLLFFIHPRFNYPHPYVLFLLSLFTSSHTSTITNLTPLHTLSTPILDLIYILLAAPHLLMLAPNLFTSCTPTCDSPAPHVFVYCLSLLLCLLCAPPLITHTLSYFIFHFCPS